MSHRVTTETEIKDKALAVKALKQAGMAYQEHGENITITSGPMRSASIDLRSGVVSGDSDFHSREVLGMLKQYYGEAKYRKECEIQGIQIESREIQANGDIILQCSMG